LLYCNSPPLDFERASPTPFSGERGVAWIDAGELILMMYAKKNNKNQRTNLTPRSLKRGGRG